MKSGIDAVDGFQYLYI